MIDSDTAQVARLVRTGEARAIRESASLSAVDMADRVGVAPRTLRAWEDGQTPRQPYAARKYLAELRRAHKEHTPTHKKAG
ncbi:helix-turn-helix domain-containing protein [Streptomyces noursei]